MTGRPCRLHGEACSRDPKETHQYGPAPVREVDDVARQVYVEQARAVLADFAAVDYTTVAPTDLAMLLGRFAQSTRFLLAVIDADGGAS